jgi:hypothetical protein
LDKIEQNCHKSEEKCAKMTKWSGSFNFLKKILPFLRVQFFLWRSLFKICHFYFIFRWK